MVAHFPLGGPVSVLGADIDDVKCCLLVRESRVRVFRLDSGVAAVPAPSVWELDGTQNACIMRVCAGAPHSNDSTCAQCCTSM